ncbi:MAG: hypothetical protein HY235_30365 [Acidobacteria bacterium]|nr:hypothetical protein [Acidobacteriota bacterium]
MREHLVPDGVVGKLHSMLEKLDHGRPVLRIYCQSLVARMYEKFATLLRGEIADG